MIEPTPVVNFFLSLAAFDEVVRLYQALVSIGKIVLDEHGHLRAVGKVARDVLLGSRERRSVHILVDHLQISVGQCIRQHLMVKVLVVGEVLKLLQGGDTVSIGFLVGGRGYDIHLL